MILGAIEKTPLKKCGKVIKSPLKKCGEVVKSPLKKCIIGMECLGE